MWVQWMWLSLLRSINHWQNVSSPAWSWEPNSGGASKEPVSEPGRLLGCKMQGTCQSYASKQCQHRRISSQGSDSAHDAASSGQWHRNTSRWMAQPQYHSPEVLTAAAASLEHYARCTFFSNVTGGKPWISLELRQAFTGFWHSSQWRCVAGWKGIRLAHFHDGHWCSPQDTCSILNSLNRFNNIQQIQQFVQEATSAKWADDIRMRRICSTDFTVYYPPPASCTWIEEISDAWRWQDLRSTAPVAWGQERIQGQALAGDFCSEGFRRNATWDVW